jgi:spore coat polysaccharide biosynthesis protein SpsF (cytidylyltransferase family)
MPKKWCSELNPRLTLDTKEDFVFLKKIYKELKNKNNFTLIDILKILDKKKNYLKINNKINQKIPINLN